MANPPFADISDMMTQNFELTRKAMENYAHLFQKGIKASPWLDADLNNKMKGYVERNIAAANEFMRKLPSQGCPILLADSGRFHADAMEGVQ